MIHFQTKHIETKKRETIAFGSSIGEDYLNLDKMFAQWNATEVCNICEKNPATLTMRCPCQLGRYCGDQCAVSIGAQTAN
ncbi:hypothetical protein SARC_13053, partial [Sphaeroforma arctica JP610]